MKPKTLVLLAVAAGCGLIAMLGIQQAMQGGQGDTPKVRVLMAKADIQPGMELSDENVGFVEIAQEAAPEDAVTAFEQYEERSLIYPMTTGDIIRQSKLGKKGEFTRSRQIPGGMRVVAISVNETQSLSGMMRPGDRVDVLVTYQVRSPRGPNTTKTGTLLKYIEVFATDNRTVSDAASKQQEVKTKVVSLLLNPAQAASIKLAESKGSLALTWRHPDDDEDVLDGAADESLLSELSGIDKLETDVAAPMYDRQPQLADVATPAPAQGVHEFLNDEQPEPAVAVVPSRPKWSLQIYQGDTPVESQFEVPEPAPQAAPGAAEARPSSDAPVTNAFRWLHRQFLGHEDKTASTTL